MEKLVSSKQLSTDPNQTTFQKYEKVCQIAANSGFDLKKQNKDHFQFVQIPKKYDLLLLILLVLFSFYTRFWRLSEPDEVIFDEVHFGKFVSWYLKGEYFFDIHPPFSKLIMSLIAKFCSFVPTFDFTNISDKYPAEIDYLCLRKQTAFVSALLPPLSYLLLRTFSISVPSSLLVAIMFIFENIILVESRIIVTDAFLFLFILLTIIFNLQLAKYRPFTFQWVLFMFLTAVALGCSVSTKLTALGTYAAVGISQIIQLYTNYRRNVYQKTTFLKWSNIGSPFVFFLLDLLTRGIVFLGSTILIFCISYYFHFNLLVFNGSGDDFMSYEFKLSVRHLNSNQVFKNDLFELGYFQKLWELNSKMHSSNMGISTPHHYSSKWYEWPLHQGTPVK
ncbi:dolichyl-phosphate-mannose--protein mannosyltransferase [Anaeramoeba flamelloides]|uniref:Dolichyl-phosphate-mannose--protein mannosyltransferase n=1 Tax=Anaeramoeba flamelloides TaxID=1746091 RepID=A0ABQ8XYL4_9EUKA|nr:dolichyl-phosphate-mannose--protein mannosyltransferase [Anaeramoeba flamelloides]